jgi:hypothetical protein
MALKAHPSESEAGDLIPLGVRELESCGLRLILTL